MRIAPSMSPLNSQYMKEANWDNYFCSNHELPTQQAKNNALLYNIKTLFIYRDPRDQIVSAAYYLPTREAKASRMSHGSLITDLIHNSCQWWAIIFQGSNVKPVGNINAFYRHLMKWQDYSFVYSIRFEDLIGEKGGGSFSKQVEAIMNIADFIDHSISLERAQQIAYTLHGANSKKMDTFRKGLIGEWKTHFNEKQKKEFKQVAGQLLIDLGYEKDFNW